MNTGFLNKVLQHPYIKVLLLIFLILYVSISLSEEINLVIADLGRHLKNGEYFFQYKKPLTTNYYSYTFSDKETINHHWLVGPIFYLIWKSSGFSGLSFFYVCIYLAGFLFFFWRAKEKSNFYTALLFSLFAVPVLATRTEVRPEVLSYLFTGIFYYFLDKYKNKKIPLYLFLVLFIVELIWVNIHILFVIGPFLTGIYLLNNLIFIKDKERFKQYIILLACLVIACFINPFGVQGLLVPFSIFTDYGYTLAENMGVFFMQNMFSEFKYLYVEILAIIMLLSFLPNLVKKEKFKIYFIELALAAFFIFFSFKMIRSLPFLGLFFIPIVSRNFYLYIKKEKKIVLLTKIFFLSSMLILFYGLFSKNNFISSTKAKTGIGLRPQIQKSAEFFIKQKIEGPIFNNYDIGGYLIFNLFPEHKVFVDNRPEAYNSDFFQNLYMKMQNDDQYWKEKEKEYGFNTIFFHRRDLTSWGQKFMNQRLSDESWVLIYADAYALIFVKNNEKNRDLIEKFRVKVQ